MLWGRGFVLVKAVPDSWVCIRGPRDGMRCDVLEYGEDKRAGGRSVL
jgi:hypothetical protein